MVSELKEFYSIQIRDIQENPSRLRIVFENYCFLREPIKNREKLHFGKVFCRVNKGYFETSMRVLLGDKIKKIEMNFIQNNAENDVCIEELIFYR